MSKVDSMARRLIQSSPSRKRASATSPGGAVAAPHLAEEPAEGVAAGAGACGGGEGGVNAGAGPVGPEAAVRGALGDADEGGGGAAVEEDGARGWLVGLVVADQGEGEEVAVLGEELAGGGGKGGEFIWATKGIFLWGGPGGAGEVWGGRSMREWPRGRRRQTGSSKVGVPLAGVGRSLGPTPRRGTSGAAAGPVPAWGERPWASGASGGGRRGAFRVRPGPWRSWRRSRWVWGTWEPSG